MDSTIARFCGDVIWTLLLLGTVNWN